MYGEQAFYFESMFSLCECVCVWGGGGGVEICKKKCMDSSICLHHLENLFETELQNASHKLLLLTIAESKGCHIKQNCIQQNKNNG